MARKIRTWNPLLLLYIFSIFSHPVMGQQLFSDTPYLSDKLIVKFLPGSVSSNQSTLTYARSLRNVLSQAGAIALSPTFPSLRRTNLQSREAENTPNLRDIYTLTLAKGSKVPDAIQVLTQDKNVLYAEPWYQYKLFYQPNDLLADSTAFSQNQQWYLDNIWAREAWDLQRNDTSVLIAYIDAGFSFLHPDLQDNLAFNVADPVDGIDNDADGYVDNYRGWDFGGAIRDGTGDNDPSYDPALAGQNHGIAVAGLSSATADNVEGIAGVSFNARYLPIKGASDSSPNFITYGYQGIAYAADQGADIINCSWGGTTSSQFGQDVIRYAVSKGAAVVAACGNSGVQDKFYPAAYPEVISVANSGPTDELLQGIPGGSTYDYSVDVSAPGTFLVGPVNDGGYNGNTGTSFSAPIVSGAVALVKGYFPQYTGFQAAQRIRVTADPHEQLQPASYRGKVGSGRINIYRGLTDPLKPSIRLTSWEALSSESSRVLGGGDTVYLEALWKNHLDEGDNLRIQLSEASDQLISSWISDRVEVGKIFSQDIIRTSGNEVSFVLNDSLRENQYLILKLSYQDPSTGYNDTEYIEILVNPPYVQVNAPKLETLLSSDANWGFYESGESLEGEGFIFNKQENTLAEGGFLIGNSPLTLADNIRNNGGRDRDFRVVLPILERNKENISSFQASSSFNDSLGSTPMGIEITQRVFTFPDVPAGILLAYEVLNTQEEELVDIYTGLFADWDVSPAFAQNTAVIDPERKLAYTHYPQNELYPYVGMILLSDEEFHAFNAPIGEGFNFAKSEKFHALSADVADYPTELTEKDVSQFISAGPIRIAASKDTTLYFGLIAGQSLGELLTEAESLAQRYACYFTQEGFPANFSFTPSLPRVGDTLRLTDNNDRFSERKWYVNGEEVGQTKSVTFPISTVGTYRVKLVSSEGNCQFTDERAITATLSTSLSPDLSEGVEVYPNPVKEILTIENVDRGSRYTLLSFMGMQLREGSLAQGENQLDVADLPAGVYVLLIDTGIGQKSLRIIKY
ncbi:MAG: S8 family peptidase [Bacteroidota bacterium]